MQSLDDYESSLLDEVALLVIKGKFDPFYIESISRLNRRYLLNIVQEIIENEQQAASKNKTIYDKDKSSHT